MSWLEKGQYWLAVQAAWLSGTRLGKSCDPDWAEDAQVLTSQFPQPPMLW
jgi:hypothetical protein